MTNEEKELLLKDLCARLPYGVKYKSNILGRENCIETMVAISDRKSKKHGYEGIFVNAESGGWDSIDDVKLYLRPMSSMTEEELNECVCQSGIKDIECPNWQDIPKEKQFEARLNHAIAVFLTDSNNIDWLNAHHFDFRNLISKGLAIDCTDLNIY